MTASLPSITSKLSSAALSRLKSAAGAWDRFWFDPLDPFLLGILRVLTGGMLFYNLAVWSLELEAFFSAQGLQPVDVVRRIHGPRFVSSFWMLIEDRWLWPAHLLSLSIAALFAAGVCTRLTSLLSFLIAISYAQRVPVANFGLDQIVSLLCLYLAIGPSGAAVSVEAWWRGRRARNGQPAVPVVPLASARTATRLIQLHLSAIYLWAGISKLKGDSWWTGEAFWNVIANQEYQTRDLTWMAFVPWLPFLIAHLTVAWESSFCLLVWNNRLRPVVLGMGVIMHLGIGAFLGMWTFGLIMTFAYLMFLDPETARCRWTRIVRSVVADRPLAVAPVLMLMLVAGCGRPADSPLVALERGRMLLQRGQVEEAMTLIDRAVQALPGDDEALYLRGLAYERLQLLEKALADYSECVRIAPDRTDALNNQAVTLAKLKRFEDAAQVFTRLVVLAPADALAVRNRGRCHFDLGQFDLALRDYDRAIELAPEDASAWLQRGNVQLAKKEYLLAESDYSRAVELDPELAAAWMNRGVSRYRRGERAAAKDDLARARQLDDSIAIPALDYFPAVPSQPDEAVPFDGGVAQWPAARAIAEFSLRLNGVTTGEWISEVATHNCGVVRATDDAGPLLVVVACLHRDGRQFAAPPELVARWTAQREQVDGVEPAAESIALLLLERAADNPELWQAASFTRDWRVASDQVNALIIQRP